VVKDQEGAERYALRVGPGEGAVPSHGKFSIFWR